MESNDDFEDNGPDDDWFVINPAGEESKVTEAGAVSDDEQENCDVGDDDGIPSISHSKPKKLSFILPDMQTLAKLKFKHMKSKSRSFFKDKQRKTKPIRPIEMQQIRPKTLRQSSVNFDELVNAFRMFQSSICQTNEIIENQRLKHHTTQLNNLFCRLSELESKLFLVMESIGNDDVMQLCNLANDDLQQTFMRYNSLNSTRKPEPFKQGDYKSSPLFVLAKSRQDKN